MAVLQTAFLSKPVVDHIISVFNPFDTSGQQASTGSTDPFGMSSFNPSQKSPQDLNTTMNSVDRDFLDLQVCSVTKLLH